MGKAAEFLKIIMPRRRLHLVLLRVCRQVYKEAALIPFAEVRLSLENEWVREMFLEGLGVSRWWLVGEIAWIGSGNCFERLGGRYRLSFGQVVRWWSLLLDISFG